MIVRIAEATIFSGFVIYYVMEFFWDDWLPPSEPLLATVGRKIIWFALTCVFMSIVIAMSILEL